MHIKPTNPITSTGRKSVARLGNRFLASRSFLRSLAAAAFLLAHIQASDRPTSAAISSVLPEEAAMREWLLAYNRNDTAQFEKFAAARYSQKELEERDASLIANGSHYWFHNYGAMTLVGTPVIKPGEVEAMVYASAVDACCRLFVELEGPAKEKIAGVYLSPFIQGRCGERHDTVRNLKDFAAQTESYISELANAERFSGAVLITKRGQPLVSKAVGFARVKPAVRNCIDTRFELASLSKLFTAFAVAKLVEQERLSYDARIADVLPKYPGKADSRRITVRQLLSHTSGLSDYYQNGTIFADYRPRRELQEYWPLFAARQLESEPGAKYNYSNSNYVVLGSIVERISGLPFAEFVETEIFQPLKMKSSCYCSPGPNVSAQPRSKHTALAGPARKPIREGWIEVPDDWPRPAVSAGHSMSTAGDMARFGSAILKCELLSKTILSQMLRRDVEMDDGGYSGLGFEIYKAGNDFIFGHSGTSWGVRTQVDLYPALDVVVVILSNSETSGTEALKYKTRQWLASLAKPE